ncbi:probable WRKY transcription factor 14 isoform X1 [Gossypium raimondii]|uniref:WRKY domain-containing protein n=2 Tax=Gossypium TaxID=3633 RepID=A0A0D2VGJ0_GOSRA|nr:probable WRKY transcription factor 14 isoform X1 [Gossypium raimondii]KJB69125.1 hypothetical protein B456_011G006600 [Gossypium raimondii]
MFFGLEMENYQGDLNDIVRASAEPAHFSDMVPQLSSWQQEFPSSDPLSFSSSAMEDDYSTNTFGDPFSAIRDPLLLLQELNVVGTGSSSTYFNNSPNSTNDHHHMGGFDDMTSPCNIFSRIQISHSSNPLPPCDPPRMAAASTGLGGHKAPAVFPSDMVNAKSCLIDNTAAAASVPVQISSPRNLGIKRRLGKSQGKKVVCIPAPAAANSRSSGEVVPSDLWAWRKYGQKPIKGSPYPRGYYRCSSSKGCSARKQVERSRTDPNMLVITYTSEHNHPWPTQRNALAGSTRSQPSKPNANNTGSKMGSPSDSEPQKTTKETIKEETEMDDMAKQQLDIDEATTVETQQQQHDQDFFADLDEILFDQQKENKPMDPFTLFDYNNASF